MGGLHGNEPAGVHALQRVLKKLVEDRTPLNGRLIALTGNGKALERDQRFLDEDLNRIWHPERLERVRRSGDPAGHERSNTRPAEAAEQLLTAEEEEMRELDREMRAAQASATGDVYFLDLHSTSASSPAFVTLDDNLRNRRFAFALPVPHVVGLEEELAGTLVDTLCSQGVVAIGFESGQHRDPKSVDRAEAAIWISLETAGILAEGSRSEVDAGRKMLAAEAKDLPAVMELSYRHAITPEDEFVMRPGYQSFQPIAAGEILADSKAGTVSRPQPGIILMPLYQGLGNDGFFVVQEISKFWLLLSAWVRRLHLERVVHWLPGVKKHGEIEGAFAVDTRKARWLALEFFHLLGFRRHAKSPEQLVMIRRNDEG